MNDEHILKARALIAKAQRIVALTGAGASAESGIKTFRAAEGLWEEHSIEDVATPEGFKRDPQLVWRFYNERRRCADVATPNAGHIALARMESLRLLRQKLKSAIPPFLILTQNIDGLHQQAGSQNVLELHGSIWKVRCTGCERVSEDFPIQLPVPPRCADCASLLRPHVVWFGEMLEEAILEQADQAVEACDLFLVIGTSALVHPAAAYPFHAAQRHVPVIEINLEPTPVTKIATLSLLGKAGDLLPQLL